MGVYYELVTLLGAKNSLPTYTQCPGGQSILPNNVTRSWSPQYIYNYHYLVKQKNKWMLTNSCNSYIIWYDDPISSFNIHWGHQDPALDWRAMFSNMNVCTMYIVPLIVLLIVD